MQYASQPLSRAQIRQYARKLRKTFGLDSIPYFPVPEFLEKLLVLFQDKGLSVQIVEEDELEAKVHAHYDLNSNTIRIRNSVYLGACDGNGRDRMTIIHEIAHFLIIKHSGVVLNRSYGDYPVPAYCNPEWQAKCLAGELMIPSHLINGISAEKIADICGVSVKAASYQLSHLK